MEILVVIGGLQLLVFFGQLLVFGYQARKLRQVVLVGSEQSGDMKASAAEAARSAVVMARVAQSMDRNVDLLQEGIAGLKEGIAASTEVAARQKDLSQMQSRAYLSVVFGSAIFQE